MVLFDWVSFFPTREVDGMGWMGGREGEGLAAR